MIDVTGARGRLAPIVIFVYKRPNHTRAMLESLLANPEIQESPIQVYCDGPRSKADLASCKATREVVSSLLPAHAKIIERDENHGLANSIIEGVTNACETYGRAIVIEDDLRVSKNILKYFNRALDVYEPHQQIMHVAGYMFPVRAKLPQVHFYREASCWGWATWKRAWRHFNADTAFLLEEIEKRGRRHAFNIDGSMDYYRMLQRTALGELDSWAIRWYASVFLNDGLAVHPGNSMIANNGFDGTGEHCGVSKIYEVRVSDAIPETWPMEFQENHDALRAMMEFRCPGITRPGAVRRVAAGGEVGTTRSLSERYLARLRLAITDPELFGRRLHDKIRIEASKLRRRTVNFPYRSNKH